MKRLIVCLCLASTKAANFWDIYICIYIYTHIICNTHVYTCININIFMHIHIVHVCVDMPRFGDARFPGS